MSREGTTVRVGPQNTPPFPSSSPDLINHREGYLYPSTFLQGETEEYFLQGRIRCRLPLSSLVLLLPGRTLTSVPTYGSLLTSPSPSNIRKTNLRLDTGRVIACRVSGWPHTGENGSPDPNPQPVSTTCRRVFPPCSRVERERNLFLPEFRSGPQNFWKRSTIDSESLTPYTDSQTRSPSETAVPPFETRPGNQVWPWVGDSEDDGLGRFYEGSLRTGVGTGEQRGIR